ncbi:MAG: protealysin inhibitor emfourin, partial [Nocardioidaceae bacterium]
VDVDTCLLDDAEASRVEDLVRRSGVLDDATARDDEADEEAVHPPPVPDGREYTITVVDRAVERSVVARDPIGDPALAELVAQLNAYRHPT